METQTIWTIGHSTHPVDVFIGMLQSHAIGTVADVRHFPGSRRHPHFGKEALERALKEKGIGYVHFPELGGRRKAKPDSLNTAWRHEAFRGYADYMETAEFRAGIGRLLELAVRSRTAIMYTEAVWWRCHRALVSDYLKAHGVEVVHILSAGKAAPHPFTSAARVAGGELSYKELL